MRTVVVPRTAARSQRPARPAEKKFAAAKSRFRVAQEPQGERATVWATRVRRTITENMNDTISLELVVGDVHLTCAWGENILPEAVDALTRGDTVWLDEGEQVTLRWWYENWTHAIDAVQVDRRDGAARLVVAPPEATTPLEVRTALSSEGRTVVKAFELANAALVLTPFEPRLSLGEVLGALSHLRRTWSLPLWGSLCVAIAELEDRHGPIGDPKTDVQWNLAGDCVAPAARPRETTAQALARWCAMAPAFFDPVNTPVRCRTGGAAVPSTLEPPRAAEARDLLRRMGHADFPSRDALLDAVRALSRPPSGEVLAGVAFSLCPQFPRVLDLLIARPQVLPPRWPSVLRGGGVVRDGLMVLADTWRGLAIDVGALPAPVSPPPRTRAVPPMKARTARRADAPEDPTPVERLKGLWSKLRR